VTKREEYKLVQNSTVTVVSKIKDKMNAKGILEQLLLERGFNVVSEDVARNQIDIQSTTDIKKDRMTEKKTLENVKKLASVYMLTFSYTTRSDFPHGKVFSSFTASVVDLRTGKLVSAIRFNQGPMGGSSINAVLEKAVEKLQ